MESSTPTRVLVVAYRTAASPQLHEVVRERVQRGPCTITLLVPRDPVDDPDTETPEQALEHAVPLFAEATGQDVAGVLGDPDPFVAVRDTLRDGFDEVIVSTLPERFSRWLKRDLPTRVEKLGVPVTVVTGPRAPMRLLPPRTSSLDY